jgi:acyl phosphate:glycerol-3-phosphate acyltransferase
MMPLAACLLAYFLGAIPFGYILVKWKTGGDVRGAGSGNIGATNVLRTTGRTAGVVTLLLDIAKGYVAVWAAGRLTGGDPRWMAAAAVVVMLGHAYPVFLAFRGGKAVASFVGAFLCLTPLALVAILVVFVGVVAWTRYVSMGSIVAAAVFPLAVWLIAVPDLPVEAAALIGAILIIYKHSNNIGRLRDGTESKFSFGVKRP